MGRKAMCSGLLLSGPRGVTLRRCASPFFKRKVTSTLPVLDDRVAVVPATFESIESAIRRFKKSCQKANILSDYRCRRNFVPRSQRRREKSLRARKRRGL